MTLCLLLMLFGCTRAFYELKGIYNVLLKVLIYTSISLLANSMLSTLHYITLHKIVFRLPKITKDC